VKLYLDDERKTPHGWVRCHTAAECIEILKTGRVTELSLDHDLTERHYAGHLDAETGYAVVIWLEEQVREDPDFAMPHVTVHSQNPAGRAHMERGLQAIRKYLRDRA
jgi:hypothetical protein